MISSKHLLLATVFLICFAYGTCSNGDRTQFFRNCRQNCERNNCTEDGLGIQEQAVKFYQQTIFDEMFLWICVDECQYHCMWKTVDAFLDRGWQVPQFYGKWPFLRYMGMQEPASVLFSIMNLIAHLKGIRRLRREVRKDSPCYKLWHIFTLVSLNGWTWSTIFHTRDFPITELLDYTFAYSIVLAMLYCMIIRMIHKRSIIIRGIVTALFLSFYLNYFAYLSVGKFSYSFNMATNITTGGLCALGWLIWCYFVRRRRPYYRKMIRFLVLFGLSMSLELLDFPPILWTFDAHSLWHLATVPLSGLFYSFVIEDCQHLRKEKILEQGKYNKQI